MSSMLVPVAIAFGVSAILGLALTPLVMRLATLIGAVDQPNERKTHATPMPRLGGVAVTASLFCSLALFWRLDPAAFASLWLSEREGIALGIALLLMLALGIWDDTRTLSPGRKFLAQLGIASLVFAGGFGITFISFPNTEGLVQLDVFGFVVTTLWIIGVTNAVNLIDGLDGLASGVGIIACATIAPIAYLNSDFGTAILAILLAGSLLGFLRYNFNPAKIFLGDSGSLVLGLALAVLSMKSSTKVSTAFAILIPVLALGLPIMETLLSMLRRFMQSTFSKQAPRRSLLGKMKVMFLPDKSHIHHRLIASGFSHRKAVITLYLVSCFLGAGAFALTVVHNVVAALILVVVGSAASIGIRRLQYTEMAVLKNGTLLPLYDKEFINRETFQAFLDIAFIVFSFWVAIALTDWRTPHRVFSRDALIINAAVCAIQFIVLLVSGLYKRSVRLMGLKEAVRTAKSVLLAVGATAILLGFFITPRIQLTVETMILDFYLLLSCVLGSRLSFSVLKNLSQATAKEGKRVLLYGAGMNGTLVLDRMLNGELPGLVPVGFLDDDPYLEGKSIHGFTVFGGHWKLLRLINRMNLDEILIVSDHIKPEILRRLQHVTRVHGMRLRRMHVTLDEMTMAEDPDRYSGVSYREATISH